jgi:protein-S-isoprenylcysteine O-methyltransferase Ste14
MAVGDNMKNQASLLSHLVAILLLPFNVTVIIPALLLYYFCHDLGWDVQGILFNILVSIGIIVICGGLLLFALTIRQFATRGKGTLAPWDPPRELVVDGPYSYTRNPMISAVIIILFGEVIIFGSIPILLWFLYFTLTNIIYIKYKEEPGLEKHFGEDYLLYKNSVPRLFPGKIFRWKKDNNR